MSKRCPSQRKHKSVLMSTRFRSVILIFFCEYICMYGVNLKWKHRSCYVYVDCYRFKKPEFPSNNDCWMKMRWKCSCLYVLLLILFMDFACNLQMIQKRIFFFCRWIYLRCKRCNMIWWHKWCSQARRMQNAWSVAGICNTQTRSMKRWIEFWNILE